jgi:hypothetical protein
MTRKPFCAEASLERAESLAATASRVDNWILVEYRGVWGYDAVGASALTEPVKAHLLDRVQALRPAKLLFIRRGRALHQRLLSVFWGNSSEDGARLFRAELASHDELLALDFESPGEPVAHPLLLVCAHGKHDRCCARYGRPLYEALLEQVDDGWLWQVSHVGGDRFAGNLVCLPEGLYFGRVGAEEAWPVLDEHLAGRIHLECYRGRCAYTFPVQAAESRIRGELALTGIGDLALVVAEGAEGRWRVRFRAAERIVETEVETILGELTYLTCNSGALRHPRRYAAGSLRVSAA